MEFPTENQISSKSIYFAVDSSSLYKYFKQTRSIRIVSLKIISDKLHVIGAKLFKPRQANEIVEPGADAHWQIIGTNIQI